MQATDLLVLKDSLLILGCMVALDQAGTLHNVSVEEEAFQTLEGKSISNESLKASK